MNVWLFLLDLFLFVMAIVEGCVMLVYTLPLRRRTREPWVLYLSECSWMRALHKKYISDILFYLWWVVIVFQLYTISSLYLGHTEYWNLDNLIFMYKAQRRLLLAFFGYVLKWVVNRFYYLTRDNVEAIFEFEAKAYRRDIRDLVHFKRPDAKLIDLQMNFYQWMVNPKFIGLENIPKNDTKLMFVGNHQLLAFDTPLLLNELFKRYDLFIRAMGDHAHFYVPIWGKLMQQLGVVDGTRTICDALMQDKQPILVYPGGADEALKRKSDKKYQLTWKNRTGFARMAIKHNYCIIPVCSVGSEDMMDIAYDMPVGWLFSGRDLTMPLVKPSLSKLQRIYFSFGTPIPTTQYHGDYENMDFREALRDDVKREIEKGIAALKKLQQEDPQRLQKTRIRANANKLIANLRAVTSPGPDKLKDAIESAFAASDDEDAVIIH